MPACEAHYSKKKGSCSSCDICKYCTPPFSCKSKESHIVYTLTPSTISSVTSSRKKRRRGSRISAARGATRIKFASDSEGSPASAPRPLVSNKENLRRICRILDLETSVLECPEDGFTEESINNSARASD